jgi:hypothetical protein
LQLSVFPNPASDLLQISINTLQTFNFGQIRIFDVAGRNVFTKDVSFSSNKTTISVTNLPSAAYHIQVMCNGRVLGNSTLIKK